MDIKSQVNFPSSSCLIKPMIRDPNILDQARTLVRATAGGLWWQHPEDSTGDNTIQYNTGGHSKRYCTVEYRWQYSTIQYWWKYSTVKCSTGGDNTVQYSTKQSPSKSKMLTVQCFLMSLLMLSSLTTFSDFYSLCLFSYLSSYLTDMTYSFLFMMTVCFQPDRGGELGSGLCSGGGPRCVHQADWGAGLGQGEPQGADVWRPEQ